MLDNGLKVETFKCNSPVCGPGGGGSTGTEGCEARRGGAGGFCGGSRGLRGGSRGLRGGSSLVLGEPVRGASAMARSTRGGR